MRDSPAQRPGHELPTRPAADPAEQRADGSPPSARGSGRAGTAQEPPDAPRIIGDFRLERPLARGGMALVYEAHQVSLGRRVALKLIAPELAADGSYRERFMREARATMELEHPNVVPVYSAGEVDGQLYIAMRLVEGKNLEQIIEEQRPLAAERVLRIVRQISAGLDAAHAGGLVHGDVKAGNVMVQPLGQGREHCYVVDFGLAIEQDASSVTSTGSWMGTPAYVSPEQLRGEPLDARTDIYALGVLVFHALAGRPPYVREHDAGTLLAQLHAPPPSLTELRPELPRAVNEVIARALAKTPQARYASAGELAEALTRALTGEAPVSEAAPAAVGGRARPHAGNLPAEIASFVGRHAELEAVRETLAGARLVSVIGPGGVGKTTLALHLAARVLPDYAGAWVLELDAVQDAPGLELALAGALGLQIVSPDSITADLIAFIEERRLLLVLDNCEHLVADVGRLARELLAACPCLTILTTSRQPLAIAGEHVYVLGPLGVPYEDDEPDDVLASDSARLLLQRAGEQGVGVRVEPSTAATIAGICVRLEGIPLAIELAAARLRTLSIGELDRRLQRDLRVLAREADGPERQRTLDNLIEWSWRLLRGDEQAVLSRLAVFAGAFTLEAAEAVAGGSEPIDTAPLVLTLADKSLLRVDADRDEVRFRMMQPVREFCLPHLRAAAEHASARSAHRAHYLALAERAQPMLGSERGSEWLARLDQDQANIRAAMKSALQDDDSESALRLGLAMRQFWACRGLAGEGIELLTASLRESDSSASPQLQAKAHSAIAHLASGLLGDARRAEPHALEALRLARSTEDADAAAEALICLSWSESFGGRAARGLARAEEGLASESSIEDPTVLGRLLDAKAIALEQLGDTDAARRAYERARDLFATTGSALGVALVENHLGDLDLGTGDLARAAVHFSVARETAEGAGDGGSVAMATLNVALIDYLDGRRDSARELFIDSLMTNQSRGDRANIAFSIFGLALTEREADRAAELHGSAAHRLDQLDMVLSTLEGRLQRQELERLRAALVPERFGHDLARGAELGVEEIIAAAVDAPQPATGSTPGSL